MRASLGLVAVVLLLSSCTRYQYIRISSDTMAQREMNEFVTENDSLRLVYDFQGDKGPVQVNLINKSGAGFQVDWNRSFLVKGNKSLPLFTPEKKIKEQKKKKIFKAGNIIVRQHTPELIVPHGSLNKESVNLIRRGFLKGGRYKREKVMAAGFGGKVRKADFRRDNTPLTFRLQLTLVPDGSKKPLILGHSFYVSEIWTAGSEPDERSGQDRVAFTSRQTVFGLITMPIRLVIDFFAGEFSPQEDDE